MKHASTSIVLFSIHSLFFYCLPAPTIALHARDLGLESPMAQSARLRRRLYAAFTAAICVLLASPATPAYFTTSLGSALAGPSDCDDCFEQVFFGPGQTIDYFGRSYDSLYVGSNGYVTFGSGLVEYAPQSLLARFAPPMIAAVWTDLDTRGDVDSSVLVDNSQPGQIIVTWNGSGHFSVDYSTRVFAQLVVRSSQYVISPGQGQIGFFYGAISDANLAAAGFSNGNPSIDDGDLQFNFSAASDLSNRELWMAAPVVDVPPIANSIPEPEIPLACAIGALVAGLVRTRRLRQARVPQGRSGRAGWKNLKPSNS